MTTFGEHPRDLTTDEIARIEAIITLPDGTIVDTDTGEIIFHPPFVLDTPEKLDWVMSMYQHAAAVVQMETDKRAAIIANCDKRIRQAQREIDALNFRWKYPVEEFVRAQLGGAFIDGKYVCKGNKSIRTPYGVVGYSPTGGGIKVRDGLTDRAIAWLKRRFRKIPEFQQAVKVTTTVLVTPLKGHEAELPTDIFDVTPKLDAFYIRPTTKG